MTKKKTTKQIRAIDRIIKFQIDDGIESLTISGKEVLADLSVDKKNNVTLFLNADKDKLNEIQSLVPFIKVVAKETGEDPDKKKAVDLVQDLRDFSLELASDSEQLATIIKTESSITIDFAKLITILNTITDDIDTTKRTADRAERKADKAQETADGAKQTADDALVSADTAYNKAVSAETKAGNAESLAISAETSANSAFNKASLNETNINLLGGQVSLLNEKTIEQTTKLEENVTKTNHIETHLNSLKLNIERETTKTISRKSILGVVKNDNFNNLLIENIYDNDISTIEGVFLSTSEFSTIIRGVLVVKAFWGEQTRTFNHNFTIETPNKGGLTHYSLLSRSNVLNMVFNGYDSKYRSGYKNTFNIWVDIYDSSYNDFNTNIQKDPISIKLPLEIFTNGNVHTVSNESETGKITKLELSFKAITIEQSITNDKYKLGRE